MNNTQRLLQVLGSPFCDGTPVQADGSEELYAYSYKNKMPLFYLDRLKQAGKLGPLEARYNDMHGKYVTFLESTARVGHLLDSAGIGYVIYKTIRPYPTRPNDIDVLTLAPEGGLADASQALLNGGYVTWRDTFSPHARRLRDPVADMNVDLAGEIAASHVIYLDKRKLATSVCRQEVPGAHDVSGFEPEAELVTVIAHSVIGEQAYTLGEYETVTRMLAAMDDARTDRFVTLLRQCNMTFAARVHLTITVELHQQSHGFVPERLAALARQLGTDSGELARLRATGLAMPHSYRSATVVRALAEKLHEKRALRSMGKQVVTLTVRPRFARQVFHDIIVRRTREGPPPE